MIKIFLSSTCYDLADLRARLAAHLAALGHTVLRSDQLGFPVDPKVHRHDACIEAVRSAELFILVIDRRFGAEFYQNTDISVSWAELRQAKACHIPIFAFVRASVFNERLTWKKNGEKIVPAHCDDARSFRLLDEIQSDDTGVWCQSFVDAEDLVVALGDLSRIGGGALSANVAASPQCMASVDSLSREAREHLHETIGKELAPANVLRRKDVERALQALRRGYIGVMLDFELSSGGADDLFIDIAIRPAEDDGSSWHVERQLTVKGLAVREELQSALSTLVE